MTRLTSDWLSPAQNPFKLMTPYMVMTDKVTPAVTKDGITTTHVHIKTKQTGSVGKNGTQCFLPQNTTNMAIRKGR